MALQLRDFNTIADAASFYANELVGHSLAILYMDSSTTVDVYIAHFSERNFMHLTGVCHVTFERFDANRFFRLALEKRLIADDFKVKDRHHTHRKLDALVSTLKSICHATMIGTYNNSGPLLVTDQVIGSVHSCLGFMRDRATGLNYPNTLLNTDVRQKLHHYQRICAIFRKRDDELFYSEMTHLAKDVPWNIIQFPSEYQYLKEIILNSESKQHP